MRIKPIPFNYGELAKDMPETVVLPQRKNVVIDNEMIGMWGEHIDPDNQIMLLTSIAVKRSHTKDTKETLTDIWENHLKKYVVDKEPEEIVSRIKAKAKKDEEKAKLAEQAVKRARKSSKKADVELEG